MTPPNTEADTPPRTKWWGEFRLEEGELGRWRIGPLDLWIRRSALDWRYGESRSGDYLSEDLEVLVPVEGPPGYEDLPAEKARYGYARTEAEIRLVPALADRPVVARPAVPFSIPPGQSIELFVSTPVWVRLAEAGITLAEIPSTRPSDTWFGTNTRGELCYAMRSHLRRTTHEVLFRPHRAVSCLRVDNVSGAQLLVERLSVPVPQLSLFASPSGGLWTEHVLMRMESEGDLAEVSLGEGPPAVAGGGEVVSRPREPRGHSFGSLVFGGLFGTGQ